MTVDFRFIKDGRASADWVQKSAQDALSNRLVWVVGDGVVDSAAREYARSRKMVERNGQKRASLGAAKLQLLANEELRMDELGAAVDKARGPRLPRGGPVLQGPADSPARAGGRLRAGPGGLQRTGCCLNCIPTRVSCWR